jgi:RNA polymerase sigma-70 factor (ECF subfamily)
VRDALERFEGPLLLYASRLLRDPHGAQDVVQEAFLRLLAAERAAVAPRLPGWLYAVVRNLAFDRMRRERWMERPDSAVLDARPGAAGDPAERAAARDQAAAALRALESLPEKQREALRLRLQHGLSYREVAEVMDVTVNHVGVLLHEGLKALRRRLGVAVAAPAPPSAPEGATGGKLAREELR